MTIALIGNNDGPSRLAAALAGSGHEVAFIGLQNGRGDGARVYKTGEESEVLQVLDQNPVDLVFNCFANFRYRTVHHRYPLLNLHLAPLPRYRGRHPLQWALINGEAEYGFTIHAVNDAFDDGPIYWQENIPVGDGWSAGDLREALLRRAESGFAAFLDRYPTSEPRPNPRTEATYVTRRYPADSRLTDLTDRDRVFRTVHALRGSANPAYSLMDGEKLTFTDARRGDRRFVGAYPGTVVGRDAAAVEVVCGDGRTIWLTTDNRPAVNQRIFGAQIRHHE